MKWTTEAEEAVKRVPFFVRKRVRSRVEKEAIESGRKVVSLADVKATQSRYLSGMESEIKGFRVETCFGAGGCPNRAIETESLVNRIEQLLEAEDLFGFLKEQVREPLKFHHEFRVAVADCPNACSQPQIRDIGIIGAALPEISDAPCTGCEACIPECKEKAVSVNTDIQRPIIDFDLCVKCGRCAAVCPAGTILIGKIGFRIQIGGKLGRHPRLATELPGLFDEEEVIHIVRECVSFYKKHSRDGRRFGTMLNNFTFDEIVNFNI